MRLDGAGDGREVHHLAGLKLVEHPRQVDHQPGVGVTQLDARLAHEREAVQEEVEVGLALKRALVVVVDVVDDAVDHEVVHHHGLDADLAQPQRQIVEFCHDWPLRYCCQVAWDSTQSRFIS